MPDTVPSDHPTVDSHRVSVGQVGRTGRVELALPAAVDATAGDIVFLSLDGDGTYAQVESILEGEPVVRGAFANRRLARSTGEGEDRLTAWLEDCGLETGETVVLDVLTPGFAYGLREPGARVVYAPPDPPDSSLVDIASSLAEDGPDE